MPKIISQPQNVGDLPRLHTEEEARALLRAGRNKWWAVLRNRIEFVKSGRSRLYTAAALLAYLQQQTHKPTTMEPKPRRAAPRKAVPVPSKGRRRKADQGERVAQ